MTWQELSNILPNYPRLLNSVPGAHSEILCSGLGRSKGINTVQTVVTRQSVKPSMDFAAKVGTLMMFDPPVGRGGGSQGQSVIFEDTV